MTNYEKLFGTLEQAASTLSEGRHGCPTCEGCIMQTNNYPCFSSFVSCPDAILAWLQEEATDDRRRS